MVGNFKRIMGRLISCGAVWKTASAGALAGLAASWVMNQFQSLWAKAAKELSTNSGTGQESGGEGEDATVKTAEALSHKLFCHELAGEEKKWAGPVVHYSFGTLVGAVYGVLAESVPATRAGSGAVYGTIVWLVADEIGVPVFGLSKPSWEAPASSHARALASHLVYGISADLARRFIV